METDTVAKTYAQALYEAAEGASQIDALSETAEGLLEVWQREPGLKAVLAHPGIAMGEKQTLVAKCFGFLEEELMKNFLGVLIEKNRIAHLGPILASFGQIVDESRGIERAKVVSAVALDDSSKESLKQVLSKRFGKTILLEEKVDASLIAGLKVRVGDQVFDGSSETVLKNLSARLGDLRLNLDLWEK